jgi:hypothetical protein
MTSFYWVGYDGLTLLLMLLALLAIKLKNLYFSMLASILTGILMGLQHFEQAFVGFGFLLLYIIFLMTPSDSFSAEKRKELFARTSFVLIGIMGGKILLSAIIASHEIPLNSGRLSWVLVGGKLQLRQLFLRFQSIVYSFLGVFWLPAIAGFIVSRKKSFWLGLFVLLLSFIGIAADQTRVAAIVTFPIIFSAALDNPNFLKLMPDKLVTAYALTYIIEPYSWVWNGIQQPLRRHT